MFEKYYSLLLNLVNISLFGRCNTQDIKKKMHRLESQNLSFCFDAKIKYGLRPVITVFWS